MDTSPPLSGISASHWQQVLSEHGYDPQHAVSTALWKHWTHLGLNSALQFHAADILTSVVTGRLSNPLAVLKSAMIRHQQLVQLGQAAPELAPERPQVTPTPYGRGDLIWLTGAPQHWGEASDHGEHPAQVVSHAQHTLTVWPVGEGHPLHLDLRDRPRLRAARVDEIDERWTQRRTQWLSETQMNALRPVERTEHGSDASIQAPEEEFAAPKPAPQRSRTNRTRSGDPTINLRLQFGGYMPGLPPEIGGPPTYVSLPDMDAEAHLTVRRTAPRWSALMHAIHEDMASARDYTARQMTAQLSEKSA